MNIGIDIDDTLTNTNEASEEYVLKYETEHPDIKIDHYKLIRGKLDTPELKEFFSENARNICDNATIKENAKNIIDKLRSEGYKIYFITARSNTYFKDAYKYVEEYLKKNDINYDKIITSHTYKVQICKDEEIDFMFDDGIDTIESLNKNNIKGAVFTSRLNKERETSSDRVGSWLELYDYIHKNCKNSKIKKYSIDY